MQTGASEGRGLIVFAGFLSPHRDTVPAQEWGGGEGMLVTPRFRELHRGLFIKTATSVWLKNNQHFKNFEGWAEGYAAFTISHKDRNRVINYIKGQKEHHFKESFIDEYKRLLHEYGIEFDEKYLL